MKILTHACCAPCANVYLNNPGYKTDLIWYNHNIHPVTEYRSRRDALVKFAHNQNINLLMHDYYGLHEFIPTAMQNLDNRCTHCYKARLQYTAKIAKAEGYDVFSTTLLASPYQNFDLINLHGNQIAKASGLEFITKDLRQNFKEGVQEAREDGYYIQKYCGCIFSEQDRYIKPRERK